jgi:hypothetical protein
MISFNYYAFHTGIQGENTNTAQLHVWGPDHYQPIKHSGLDPFVKKPS